MVSSPVYRASWPRRGDPFPVTRFLAEASFFRSYSAYHQLLWRRKSREQSAVFRIHCHLSLGSNGPTATLCHPLKIREVVELLQMLISLPSELLQPLLSVHLLHDELFGLHLVRSPCCGSPRPEDDGATGRDLVPILLPRTGSDHVTIVRDGDLPARLFDEKA